MNWYYASNNEQKGPVDQTEFERLIQSGVVTGSTLVWREGLVDWQPYGELGAAASAPPPQFDTAKPGAVCSECGRMFALDEMIRLGSGFVCASCKPIAMQKLREGVVNSDAEQIRKEHIKHEASVKSVGILYFLGALVLLPLGLVNMAMSEAVGIVMGLVFLVFGAAQVWLGVGLRKLRPWARIPTAILSGIGLLGFPAGTLINAYILYLVVSKKGVTVFSEDYQRIIEETPHIKYRTSILVWILLVLVLALIAAAILVPLISAGR